MKKIRLSTVSQVYEAFLHSRKALGAKEVIKWDKGGYYMGIFTIYNPLVELK